jgi:hypothetical protein
LRSLDNKSAKRDKIAASLDNALFMIGRSGSGISSMR